MKKKMAFIFLLFSLALTANETNSTEKKDSNISLGVGVIYSNGIYKREDNTRIGALPFVTMEYKNIYYKLPLEIGYKIYNGENLKLSTYLVYNILGGYKPKDMEDEFKGMDKRKGDLHLGLNKKYTFTPIKTGLHSYVSADVSGKSKGVVARVELNQPVPFGKRIFMRPYIAVNYMSKKYVDYYYGITEDEAVRGINKGVAYKPNDAFNFETGAAGMIVINDKFNILVLGNYTIYDKSIKDSPLVRKDNGYMLGTGFTYTF